MALCVLDDVKGFLEIKSSETGKDALITLLIPAAQDLVESYCRRVFDQAVQTEYHHGGVDRIFVRRPPIALTPKPVIYEDPNRVFDVPSIVETDDFYVGEGPDDGTIFFFYQLEKGYGGIKVVYTGGFSTVPPIAKQACMELVARKMKSVSAGDFGVHTRHFPGGGTVVFQVEDILPETKLLLDAYRLEL